MARRTFQKQALGLILLAALSAPPRLALAEDLAPPSPPAPAENTVDVEGTRPHPTAIAGEPGVSGSHVDREQLDKAGVTLPDALRSVPGLTVTQSGGMGAPATARVRGASALSTTASISAKSKKRALVYM